MSSEQHGSSPVSGTIQRRVDGFASAIYIVAWAAQAPMSRGTSNQRWQASLDLSTSHRELERLSPS